MPWDPPYTLGPPGPPYTLGPPIYPGPPHMPGRHGGSPVPVLQQIRELLSIGRDPCNDREDFLDVYVFGVGELVHPETLNALASHKDGEEHVWVLRDLRDLQRTFHMMIGPKPRDSPQKSSPSAPPFPQHDGARCCPRSGFALTAARDCFLAARRAPQRGRDSREGGGEGGADLPAPRVRPGGAPGAGVPEFYDYDVALVELQRPLGPKAAVRPICLPCTEGTSRALRLPQARSTCEEHRRLLLPPKEVPAFFVSDRGPQGGSSAATSTCTWASSGGRVSATRCAPPTATSRRRATSSPPLPLLGGGPAPRGPQRLPR
ncbi:complement factor B-like [Anser cygnoides]|uniref:complement factor B-like n=1 Tax=Anser cygnoides TaxID=8845 RepID=UPI0034D3903D